MIQTSTSPYLHVTQQALGRATTDAWPGYAGIIAAITIFAPLIDGGTTQVPVAILRLLILSACGLCLFRAVRLKALSLPVSNISSIGAVFVAVTLGSLIWTPYVEPALQSIVMLCMYVLFFHIVLLGVEREAGIRLLVTLILGVGLFEGIFGVVQFMWFGAYRAVGTFFNPNFFATYEAAVLVLSTSLLLFLPKGQTSNTIRVVLTLGCFTAAAALVMARSRGAMMAVTPVLTVIALVRFGKPAIPVAMACLLLVATLPNPIRERTLQVSSQDPFAYTRVDMWRNALTRVGEQPWGIGLGMYKYASFKSRFPIEGEVARYGKRPENAHSEYLQMAVELGVLGFLIFIVGVWFWWRDALGVLRQEKPTLRYGVIIGLMGVVSTILLHAAVDSVFHEPALVLLLLLAAGLVLVCDRDAVTTEGPSTQRSLGYTPGRALIGSVLLLLLLGLTVQPVTAWYAFDQGNRASANHNHERALTWFQRATTVEPWNAAYHGAMASTLVALFQTSGRWERVAEAIEELNLSAALNRLDGRYPYRIGTLYQMLGDRASDDHRRAELFRQAEEAYQRAVDADPFSPLSYVAMAMVHTKQGRQREARALLKAAIQHEPNYLPARELRVKLSLESGDRTMALEEFQEIQTRKRRFEGKSLSVAEQQFLDVDLGKLKQMVES